MRIFSKEELRTELRKTLELKPNEEITDFSISINIKVSLNKVWIEDTPLLPPLPIVKIEKKKVKKIATKNSGIKKRGRQFKFLTPSTINTEDLKNHLFKMKYKKRLTESELDMLNNLFKKRIKDMDLGHKDKIVSLYKSVAERLT